MLAAARIAHLQQLGRRSSGLIALGSNSIARWYIVNVATE